MIPFESRKVVPFIIFLIVVFVILVCVVLGIDKRKMSSYPDIRKIDSVEGVIRTKKNKPSGICVELYDGKNFFILDSYNESIKPSIIGEFLMVGDSVFKPYGTDSLIIIKGSKKYDFVIGKRIKNE